MSEVTAARLRELLDYNPATGVFQWKISPRLGGVPLTGGMRQIKIDGKLYRTNRLAWLYVHGEMPRGLVDHKNLDPLDHRIDNLRLATRSQNGANARMRKNNRSGFKGVIPFQKGWQACIRSNGIRHYLGYFKTPEEAHEAYCAAAKRLHGEFARLQ